jgi:hypothetical protein
MAALVVPLGNAQRLSYKKELPTCLRQVCLYLFVYCGGKGWIGRPILEGGRVLDFWEAENYQCYMGGAQEAQVKRTNHRGSARM